MKFTLDEIKKNTPYKVLLTVFRIGIITKQDYELKFFKKR